MFMRRTGLFFIGVVLVLEVVFSSWVLMAESETTLATRSGLNWCQRNYFRYMTYWEDLREERRLVDNEDVEGYKARVWGKHQNIKLKGRVVRDTPEADLLTQLQDKNNNPYPARWLYVEEGGVDTVGPLDNATDIDKVGSSDATNAIAEIRRWVRMVTGIQDAVNSTIEGGFSANRQLKKELPAFMEGPQAYQASDFRGGKQKTPPLSVYKEGEWDQEKETFPTFIKFNRFVRGQQHRRRRVFLMGTKPSRNIYILGHWDRVTKRSTVDLQFIEHAEYWRRLLFAEEDLQESIAKIEKTPGISKKEADLRRTLLKEIVAALDNPRNNPHQDAIAYVNEMELKADYRDRWRSKKSRKENREGSRFPLGVRIRDKVEQINVPAVVVKWVLGLGVASATAAILAFAEDLESVGVTMAYAVNGWNFVIRWAVGATESEDNCAEEKLAYLFDRCIDNLALELIGVEVIKAKQDPSTRPEEQDEVIHTVDTFIEGLLDMRSDEQTGAYKQLIAQRREITKRRVAKKRFMALIKGVAPPELAKSISAVFREKNSTHQQELLGRLNGAYGEGVESLVNTVLTSDDIMKSMTQRGRLHYEFELRTLGVLGQLK